MLFYTVLLPTKELTSKSEKWNIGSCPNPRRPEAAGMIERWNGLLKTVTAPVRWQQLEGWGTVKLPVASEEKIWNTQQTRLGDY